MQPPTLESLAAYHVSRESLGRLEILVKLLLEWQKHINLIAPSTIPEVWNRHVIDSLQLVPLLPAHTQAIADLGSGAGFPALVLAAVQPATVHMYEANAKKVAFMHEALRQMKCCAVVHSERLEPLSVPTNMPKVQVVTARAFAPLPLLLDLAEPFLRGGAVGLFHKGQDINAELTEAAKSWRITFVKHKSPIDSQSGILEVKEIVRVQP
jgi:16S rRNA (guanine527-N7)-methyltransferase